MIDRYFVYDKMMLKKNFESTLQEHVKVMKSEPAFISARMFMANNQPICVDINTGKLRHGGCIIYGVIHEVEIDKIGIELFDRIQSCSLSIMGINYVNDLTHRVISPVKVIKFDSVDSFINYEYEVIGDDNVWVYLGNPQNPYIKDVIFNNSYKHKRCNVWRDFFNVTY